MKFIYSQLSSDSVLEIINSHYELGNSISSKFYVHGLHDNYLIESRNRKYIFRLYRNNWRTKEEILFEIDLLSYLEKTSSNVAAPVKSKNNELVTYIEAPEGIRSGVLFHYAEGHPPSNDISCEECHILGVSVAKIHENSDGFKSKYKRETLDLPYLVDDSLKLIRPFLNASQFDSLSNIREIIFKNISNITPNNSDFGICTGDINLTNFHINKNKIITHFDFDQCGYGFRVFEIGKFTSGFRRNDVKHDKLLAFINGYESVREISENEKRAIPYFEIVAPIWVLAIHASNVDKIGYQYLDEGFWKKRMEKIEALTVVTQT